MAETSMNFGPEWIRNLTESKGGGLLGGVGVPKSQQKASSSSLSSGPRYNKEEMFERMHRMLDEDPSSSESSLLMFPPDYLDPEYCRHEPSLKRPPLEDGGMEGSSPANSEASLRFYKKEGLLACLSEETLGGDPSSFERSRHHLGDGKGPRSYERSMSDRGGGGGRAGGSNKWYERSNTLEEKMNGGTSPRKTYTRVPFDDWRKTPSSSSGSQKEEEWRTISKQSSNSRWSVWRSPLDGDSFRKFDFPKSNATAPSSASSKNPKWREDASSYKIASSRGGGGSNNSPFLSSRGGGGGLHAYRRRQESTDALPEWAHDDMPLEKIGGSFDSAGKFQQPFKGGEAHERVVLDNVDEGKGPDPEVQKNEEEAKESNNNKSSSRESNGKDPERRTPDRFKEELLKDRSETREKGPASSSHHSESGGMEDVVGSNSSILSSVLEEDDDRKKHKDPPSTSMPIPSSPGHIPKPAMRIAEAVEEYKWIYLDPEGKTQGSFPSIQMLDWFQKGYFPPDLRLRRTIDKRFMQLSEFTKLIGYIPFLPGIQFPPLETEDEALKLQQQMREHASYMRQLQAQLLMQQLLQQQQQEQQQQQQFINSLQQGPPTRPDPHLVNKLMQMLGTNGGAPPPFVPGSGANPGNLLGGGVLEQRPPLMNGPEPHQPADPIKQLLAQQSIRPPISFPSPDIPSSSSMSGTPLDTIQKASPPIQQQQQSYDPIKSLLAQLQLSAQPQNVPPSQASGSYFNPLEPNNDPLPHRIVTDAQQTIPHSSSTTSHPQNSIWDMERPNNIPFKAEQPLHPSSSVSQIWNKSSTSSQLIQPQNQMTSDDLNFQMHQAQNLERLKQQEELIKRQELQKQEEFFRQQEELEKKKQELRRQQEEFDKQQELLLRQKEFQQMNGHLESSPTPGNQEDSSNQRSKPSPSNDNQRELKHDDFEVNELSSAAEVVNFDDFVKPKFNEKKDRKARKAEEKKKSREAKKEGGTSQQKYIPGMEGSQKPSEPIVAGGGIVDDYDYEQESQEEALTRLREEQQAVLIEKEKQQSAAPALIQPKLAPWAKKVEETQSSNELSLTEIQKIEAERERETRLQREAQMREIQKEEEAAAAAAAAKEALITPKTKWAQNTQAEDFLQIVQEEYRLEKARQEKEKKNKKNRQKDIGLAQASVWGSGSANLSWASKTSSNIASQVVQPVQSQKAVKNVIASPAVGFWEDSPNVPSLKQAKNEPVGAPATASNTAAAQSSSSINNKSKKSVKKPKEESKEQRNPFEEWCTNALKSYNVQVDIPTFLSFLESIESPFEVNDYIISYIGEGKGPKSFAKEYLERRSKWKNSLKTANRSEDNLMAPATAINPGETSDFQTVKSSKSKKQRSKGGKNQKMDMSHLLGFSVASNRVNAGELDLLN